MLKVEKQDLEQRQVGLTVEVPAEQLDKAKQAAARRVAKQMKIPGFRPGKAPYSVIAGKVGDDYLFEEALDDLGQDVYRQALEEADVEPFAPGSLDEVVSKDPLVLRYTIPLSPQIDLGDYRDLRLDPPDADVKDETVEEVLEELRQGQALIEPAERAAKMGDVLVLDVTGQLHDPPDDDDGQLIDEKNASLLLEPDTKWPIPGIADELVGMSAGDEKTIEHNFPEDYAGESLQGKQATFTFKCLEVKSRLVPEWTDDLAKNVGDFDDLLSLRVKVRENLQQELESRNRQEYRDQVMEAVIEGASIEYPPSLVEREIDDMLHDLVHRLERQNLKLEDYLTMEGKSLDDLREEARPEAEARLQRGLVLGEIVDLEGLKIDESDTDAALDRMVEPLGEQAADVRKRLDTAAYRRQIEVDLLTDKAIERLLAIARGDEVPEPGGPAEATDEPGDDTPAELIDETTNQAIDVSEEEVKEQS
jgi:trigger factor